MSTHLRGLGHVEVTIFIGREGNVSARVPLKNFNSCGARIENWTLFLSGELLYHFYSITASVNT